MLQVPGLQPHCSRLQSGRAKSAKSVASVTVAKTVTPRTSHAPIAGRTSVLELCLPPVRTEANKKETKAVSYANVVKRGGDQIDYLRLACSIATSIVTLVQKRLNVQVKASDICKYVADNVALFYKTNVRGEHVYSLEIGRAHV